MTVQHYFNAAGEWIAFRRSRNDLYLFDRHGKWIGWFPWQDNDVVDLDGEYFGTVIDGNRLFRKMKVTQHRPHPGFPPSPGPSGYAGHPSYAAYNAPPLGYTDVTFDRSSRPRRPRVKKKLPPPPKPTPPQAWASRLGLGKFSDRIGRLAFWRQSR